MDRRGRQEAAGIHKDRRVAPGLSNAIDQRAAHAMLRVNLGTSSTTSIGELQPLDIADLVDAVAGGSAADCGI